MRPRAVRQTDAPTVTKEPTAVVRGKIVGVRDYVTVVLVFLDTDDGRVVPAVFEHRAFTWLLQGERCGAEVLVGQWVEFDGETMVFVDRPAALNGGDAEPAATDPATVPAGTRTASLIFEGAKSWLRSG